MQTPSRLTARDHHETASTAGATSPFGSLSSRASAAGSDDTECGGAEQGADHVMAQGQQPHRRDAQYGELPQVSQREAQRDGGAGDRADRGRPGAVQERVQERLHGLVGPQALEIPAAGHHEQKGRGLGTKSGE